MSLPITWVTTSFSEVAEINPRSFSREPNDDDLVSFVPMTLVKAESGKLDASQTRPWREVSKGFTRFEDGDVLFAKITPCMENGKYAIAEKLHNGLGTGSTEFHVFRSSRALLPRFLLYWLFQRQVRQAARMSMKGAAGQLRVPREFFIALQFQLPPRPEQDRIVAEIEKQFTRLDDAIAALKRVQANLKRYRASVLKAACEGRLVPTEAELARKEGRDYEPAEQLLARILKERRAKWEADQLAKMIAVGKPSKNDDWKKKYKEPVAPDTTNLPTLPEGWTWTTLDQLSSTIRNGVSVKPDKQCGLAILRISAVRALSVDTEDIRYLTDSEEYFGYSLKKNDLLFTRYNGNRDYVGVCGRIKQLSHSMVYPDKLIRVRSVKDETAEWIEIVVNVGISRSWLSSRIRTTAGQSGVSGDDLKKIPIPLCPESEARRAVLEIERILSISENILKIVESRRLRVDHFRHSVLREAFSGKLVPQDPADEPASVLLERIRAERDCTNRQPKRSKKTGIAVAAEV